MAGSLNSNSVAHAVIVGPSGDLTVCGWFRVNVWSGGQYQVFIYVSPPGGDGELTIETDVEEGRILAYFWDGEANTYGPLHPDDEPTGWVYCACSISGTTGKIRILRSLEDEFEEYTYSLTPWATGPRNVQIFNDMWGNQAENINGKAPRIFSSELSDSDLLTEARSPTPVHASIWADYTFDAVSGWGEDTTVNERDLTTTGTPVYSVDEPADIAETGGEDTELPVGLATETNTSLNVAGTKTRAVGIAAETNLALALRPPFDPIQVPGIIADWDVDDVVDSSGASSLPDRSGVGNDLAQATAEARLAIVSSDPDFGGHKSLQGATGRFLQRATLVGGLLAQPYTKYAVIKTGAHDSANQLIFSAANATNRGDVSIQASAFGNYAGNGLTTPATISAWSVGIIRVRVNGATSRIDWFPVVGSTVSVSGNSGSLSLEGTTLMSRWNATNAFLGKATKFLQYSGIVSDDDDAQIIDYLKRRYFAPSVGLAIETDTALALTRAKSRAVGIATETNTSLGLTRAKLKAVSRSDETDSALALSQSIPGLPIKLFIVGSSVAAGYITMSGGDPVYSEYALGRSLGLTTHFPTIEIVDTAVEGVDASWLQLVYESQVHAHFDPSKRNIIIFWEWLNSLWAGGPGGLPGGDPQEVLEEGEAYALNAQADGFEVLAGTCTPGSFEPEEENLNEFDDLLRASTVFDGIIDFSSISTLYPPGWIDNPTRFEDDIHLKDLGQEEVTTFAAAYLTDYFGELPAEDAELPVGLASETDSALALGRAKLKGVELASETGMALALALTKSIGVGLSAETDVALTIAHFKWSTVGVAAETDLALALQQADLEDTELPVGLASEADFAHALAGGKMLSVGLSVETNEALTLGRTKRRSGSLSDEMDRAYSPLDLSLYRLVGMATETDDALAVGRYRTWPMGLSTEDNEAFSLSASKVMVVGISLETDDAFALQIGFAGPNRIVNMSYKWRPTQGTGTSTAVAPAFTAYRGHALDMGTFTITAPAGFDFTGTVARLRVGRPGEAAHVEWRSDDVPSGALFGWNDATGELSIDMPSAAVDAQDAGRYTYQITIISTSGEPLGPPCVGYFRVASTVGAMLN